MSQALKTIAIICARGGSKGLRHKNVQILNGAPLVARPILQALESGVCDEVILSTDDEEIAEQGLKYGAVVPFIRPKELAADLTTTEDTLRHALVTYEELVQRTFDFGVFLTATDIFRQVEHIRQCVALLKNDPALESAFVGSPTHKNFWEQEADGRWVRLKPEMRLYASRQVRKPIIREDTGLGCASRAWLWREGRRIGDNVQIVLNEDSFSGIDIHNSDDLALARAAMAIRAGSAGKDQ